MMTHDKVEALKKFLYESRINLSRAGKAKEEFIARVLDIIGDKQPPQTKDDRIMKISGKAERMGVGPGGVTIMTQGESEKDDATRGGRK